ncbi:MAG: PEP-CTERM sorting domain-containing protein [Prosthecobacter sp.]
MLIQTKSLLTMLAVAGMTLFASQANATTYVAGDLLLGFRASGGQGSSENLIVNLGQADTVYRDAVANITSVVDIGTLLTTTYGANWSSRGDLFWGIAGARTGASIGSAVDGDPIRTNYLTAAQTTVNPGTQSSTAWEIAGSTSRGSVANAIIGLAGNFEAFSAAVTNTAVLPSGTGSTWSSNNNGSSSFTLAGTVEGNFGAGAAGTALDLYRILHTTSGASPTGTVGVGSFEGTFTISNAGVVGFAVTAVPEPSRALLAGLGLAGIAFRRRRAVKKSL